jgi:hypothetical protein
MIGTHCVLGGTLSPSPIVTSLTKVIFGSLEQKELITVGNLIRKLRKKNYLWADWNSKKEQMAAWRFLEGKKQQQCNKIRSWSNPILCVYTDQLFISRKNEAVVSLTSSPTNFFSCEIKTSWSVVPIQLNCCKRLDSMSSTSILK